MNILLGKILAALFLLACFKPLCAQTTILKFERDFEIASHKDTVWSVPDGHVWQIDSIGIKADTEPDILIDGKRIDFPPDYPLSAKERVSIQSLNGSLALRGVVLKITHQNYPLIDEQK